MTPTPLPGPSSQPPRERADAARNRVRVLAAARQLFLERGGQGITMEDVARTAGVGRGTLYRRYPDVASIAVALLDEHERVLQQKLLSGEPPLGPGAPPHERLAAFYAATVDLLEEHLPLALGAETGQARYATGAYGFWRSHVRVLLDEAGVPDPEPLVDVLLAPLAPDLYAHQRKRGLTPEQVSDALVRLARGVMPPDPPRQPSRARAPDSSA